MSRYLNYHSIESNILEGVVQFNPLVGDSHSCLPVDAFLIMNYQAVIPLVRGGFYDQAALAAANITGGAVRDRPEALAILRDTREVWFPSWHHCTTVNLFVSRPWSSLSR